MTAPTQLIPGKTHTICTYFIIVLLLIVGFLCFSIYRIALPTRPVDLIKVGQVVVNPIEWPAEPLAQNNMCTAREGKSLKLLKSTDFDYIFEYQNYTVPPTVTDATKDAPAECINNAIVFRAKDWFDREYIFAKFADKAAAQRMEWAKQYQKK